MYPFGSSIDTVFGTAMHETVQEWLRLMYEKSVKASEEFASSSFLQERLIAIYKEEKKKNEGKNFTEPELLQEYYEDGIQILKYLKSKRKVLFDSGEYELIGIEIPIFYQIDPNNDKFVYNAYLDIVFMDKSSGNIIVIDFKTSSKGWGDYQKKDQIKANQVLLYKRYLSKQFGISEDKIEVKFMILKRKIYENSEYPIPRVQTYIPAQGTGKVNQAEDSIKSFISECYNPDGTVIDKQFEKKPGMNNCRFCPFKDRPDLCDQRNS